MIVVSPEPNSANATPVPTEEEFTSPKPTTVTFLVRRRAFLHVESLLPYSLVSCALWYGRFAGLNVEPPHL